MAPSLRNNCECIKVLWLLELLFHMSQCRQDTHLPQTIPRRLAEAYSIAA